MQLKTFVKVGNITNLSDARYCAGMGVDVLGFKLEQDSMSVSDQLFVEISGWLSGTAFAGEFETSDAETIKNKAKELKLDYVQLNDIELANNLCGSHKVIYQTEIQNTAEISALSSHLSQLDTKVPYALISASTPDLHEPLTQVLEEITLPIGILKGFDITEANVLKSIEASTVAGIALHGSNEIRPGFKDYDELADILETLEFED